MLDLKRRIDILDLNRRRSWTALAVIGAALALSGTALAADAGGASPAGSVDEAPIKAIVQEHRAQIRACYETAQLGSPGLEGKLVFAWSITPAGAVGEGCVTSSDFSSDASPKLSPEQENELWDCVSTAVREWKFPPPKNGKKVEVSYPFVFKQVAPPFVATPEEQ